MSSPVKKADVTIVIPQFGRAELTCACIESLRHHEPVLWPVLVVDDGSPAEDICAVSDQKLAGVRLVRQEHAGVTAAWNLAVSQIETAIAVFVNNDVLLDGPAIERLAVPLRENAALVCGAAWRRERMLPPGVLQRLPTDRFLQGWCFAVRIETVRRLGGFDRSMRLYWSDTDFQARAMLAASARDEPLVCCPNLPIRHFGHRTAARVANRSATWRADRAAFIAKWSPQ